MNHWISSPVFNQVTPFQYSGTHYHISIASFRPVPIQKAHVQVWVAGHWPNEAPLCKAAHWEGIVPPGGGAEPLTPEKICEISDHIFKYRMSGTPFDNCLLGLTHGKDFTVDKAIVKLYASVGLTWWVEAINPSRGSIKKIRDLIKIGPPR